MNERHRRHANPFTFRQELNKPNWAGIFARPAPLEIEIGFGKGQFLLGIAKAREQSNFVGLEIRQFLVDDVNAKAKATALHNVHAIHCNANTAIDKLFDEQSVSRFYVHFPDPWFKKRHFKRRVINLDTAALIRRTLTAEGEVHVMTDYEPIALDIMSALQEAGFTNVFGTDKMTDTSTTGVTSEREDWHMSKNDPVYRMLFRK